MDSIMNLSTKTCASRIATWPVVSWICHCIRTTTVTMDICLEDHGRDLGSGMILNVNKLKSCTFVVNINQRYGSNTFKYFGCWDADSWCMWSVCAVKSLFAIRQAFQDPQNALASWDANYMSPCTFAYVECDPQSQSVVRLYEHKSLKFHCFIIFWFTWSIQCSFTSDLISTPPTSEDREIERERKGLGFVRNFYVTWQFVAFVSGNCPRRA